MFMPPSSPSSLRSCASSTPRTPSSDTAANASARKRGPVSLERLPPRCRGCADRKLFGIEFANGRAVAALHVVGVDFQFRLGVDLGVRRKQQRLVHLVAIGLLRAAFDLDLPGTPPRDRPPSTFFTVCREVQCGAT